MKRVLTLLAPILAAIVALTAGAQAQTVISVTDPTGDDRGPGYYGYPTNNVFQPGVFDLVRFEVQDTGKTVVFKVYLKNLGGNPWNGPNGFSLQYIHIYVHTTAGGMARMDTIGLNLALRSDYAWHFALLLAPGWGETPVPAGERSALYYANGTVVAQDDANFTVKADAASNAIIAEVNRNLIPDVENMASWRIVVAAASYDGFGPLKVRPVGPAGGEWVINGSAYAKPEQVQKIARAIALGIEPRVLDILVYSNEYPNGITAEQQYTWLDSYNPTLGTLAVVPGLPPVTIKETVTVTQTTTATVTKTETVTKTMTETRTVTTPTTVTTTVTQTNWAVAGGLAVLGLIIGLAVALLVGRK